MFSDTFTADASGAADPCTVPPEAQGARGLIISPPSGHAWSLRLGGSTATAIAKGTDEKSPMIPGPFVVGSTLAWVSLDTGSGSFSREWI